MQEWKNGLNWSFFKSIIIAFRTKKISRERFVIEYGRAQIIMGTLK
jgi:hypothetical protein